jgi:2-polyprenyl-3-methyl-5-hydroxy-6-metoxy-1,4-benzoquinol methylase
MMTSEDYNRAYYLRPTVGWPKFDIHGPVRKGPREKALWFRDLVWKKTVLDVGCGRGEQIRWWAEHEAKHVTGIDWSQDAVDIASGFCQHLTNVSIMKMDARSFHPAQRFDVVTMLDFIEHLIEDDAHTVYKLCAEKWLVPGGWVGIACPPENTCKYHFYHQSQGAMRRDLEQVGLTVEYLKEHRDTGRGIVYVAKAKLK